MRPKESASIYRQAKRPKSSSMSSPGSHDGREPEAIAPLYCRKLVSVVLAACCACAGGARQMATPPSMALRTSVGQGVGTYRISGRVVDAQGGTPLARCVMEIVDVKHGFGARTVLTGEDGRFLFEGVSPSKYRLSASKHGFVTSPTSSMTTSLPRLLSDRGWSPKISYSIWRRARSWPAR